MDRRRLEFCTEIFLSEMRRQFAVVNPGEESAIRSLAGYSPEHRSCLMAAVAKAVQAADPKNEASFINWVSRNGQGGQ